MNWSTTAESKAVVITGGSLGIGFATARLFAQRGHSVAICGRDETRLTEAAEEIRRVSGAEVLAVRADVSDESDAKALMESVVDRYGRIDVLINNVGSVAIAPLLQLDAEAWERAEAITVRSCFNCSKWAVQLGGMMERKQGHIFVTASVNVRASHAGWTAHVAFKHAQLGFTQSLQKELADHRIRVTLLCPGQVRTPLMAPELKAASSAVHQRIAMLNPEDMAHTTVFIAEAPEHVNFSEVTLIGTGSIQ